VTLAGHTNETPLKKKTVCKGVQCDTKTEVHCDEQEKAHPVLKHLMYTKNDSEF
jgi:hypothetical protein